MKSKYNEESKRRTYEWRNKNREKYNEISRRSYEKNKEKIAQKAKERYEQQKIKKVFIVMQETLDEESNTYYDVVEVFNTLRKAENYLEQNNIKGYFIEKEVK